MSVRIDIEPGTEYLLPFAKKKLEQLKRDTPQLLNKRIYTNTGDEVFIQRGFVDLIRIRGGSDFQMYTFGAGFDDNKSRTVSKPPTAFTLTADATNLPVNSQITAVGPSDFRALGAGLTFKPLSAKQLSKPINITTRFKSTFKRNLKRMLSQGDQFARAYWRYIATDVTVWRQGADGVDVGSAIHVVPDECLFSPWESTPGDCWVLLGSWQNDVPTPPDTLEGLGLLPQPTQSFNGVFIRLSEMLSGLRASAPGSTRADIFIREFWQDGVTWRPKARADTADSRHTTVQAVPPISRGHPGNYSHSPSVGLSQRYARYSSGSPFEAYVYTLNETYTAAVNVGASGNVSPQIANLTYADVVDRYTLVSGPALIHSVVDNSLLRTSASFTNSVSSGVHWTATSHFSGWTTGAYIPTTTGFMNVGTFAVPGFDFTWTADQIPTSQILTGVATLDFPSREDGSSTPFMYLPEYRIFVSIGTPLGTGSVVVSQPGSGAFIQDIFFEKHLDPLARTTVNPLMGDSALDFEGPAGESSSYAASDFHRPMVAHPAISAAFNFEIGDGTPVGISAVWYRPGPTGVCTLELTSDAVAGGSRNADMADWVSRYMAVQQGQLLPGSPTYETADVLLAKILPHVTVRLNNFAPPALFPWLLAAPTGSVIL